MPGWGLGTDWVQGAMRSQSVGVTPWGSRASTCLLLLSSTIDLTCSDSSWVAAREPQCHLSSPTSIHLQNPHGVCHTDKLMGQKGRRHVSESKETGQRGNMSFLCTIASEGVRDRQMRGSWVRVSCSVSQAEKKTLLSYYQG